jgi:prevent-host-death family protein
MSQVMSATQVRMHFGEVMRRVSSEGEPVIVERGGEPLVVVISLDDYERLRQARTGELRPENQVALDWLDRWEKTPASAGPEWWDEFERDLREHPIVLGEDE